ncbi:MAG: hypothetical protein A2161_05905 [Candidatus Schekmanbacteria bacterium RBG_13_48_7]|uniref:DUF116 domain-containing protein n=1 Tax=Candidatus Schekmanbacteria bacterium RBG_13_48_7 TaxID=1817878 RepID=A0A1F7RU50_9BACT|nr:MAG: hypothetical protein A2161_05905 [Candidatus Schekmanbacteria bacterium RBG_13_48_7]
MDERKILFIFLVVLLYILAITWIGLSLYLVKPRIVQISPLLYKLTSGIALFLIGMAGLDFFHLSISSALERKIFFSRKHSLIPIQILIPAVLYLGKVLGISKDRISNSFLKFNNSLVKTRDICAELLDPGQVLVLLPRCLQDFECTQQVTSDVKNCKQCGKCMIKDVVDLTDKFGCHTLIVTGGSAARKIIRKIDPVAIIAVACERELLSGIQDVSHLRVLSVVNKRPEGPCKNTKFSVEELERCLMEFLTPDLSEKLNL